MLYYLFLKKTQTGFFVFRKQKTHNNCCGFPFAEKEGFEPPVLLQTTVFKTAAFDRSAISPEVVSDML